MIEKARKGAFEDSAYGVLDAGRVYFVDKLADSNKFTGVSFNFPEGGDLKISGEKPAGGIMTLDSTGKQAIALFDKDKKWCALKSYEEEKITIKDYKEDECKILEVLSSHIVSKNKSGNAEGLFTDDFGNTRYRGSNPNNYVDFNNESWRIIGVFGGKIKLIRDEKIPNPNDGSVPYNASYPDTFLWNTAGTNDWTTSDLQAYLNNEYYNSLSVESKQMIKETEYNLGGIVDTKISKKTAYQLERENTVYTGRPADWTGKIGLMYISDYGYATGEECTLNLYDYKNDTCKNNDWLYKNSHYHWTLTPWSSSPSDVSYISDAGDTHGLYAGNHWLSVHPVLFLNPDVKITFGDGTSSNPYKLNL